MCRACLAGAQQSAFSVAKPKGTFLYVPCSCNTRRCLSGPDSSTQCTGQICTAVAIAFIQGKAFGLSGVVTCCRTVVGQAGWGSGFVLSALVFSWRDGPALGSNREAAVPYHSQSPTVLTMRADSH